MTTVSRIERGIPDNGAFPPNGPALSVPAPRPKRWTRIAVAWHAAVNYLVPIGYEDEAGFHYGAKPKSDTSASRDENVAENW
jgi:hypothetical protein